MRGDGAASGLQVLVFTISVLVKYDPSAQAPTWLPIAGTMRKFFRQYYELPGILVKQLSHALGIAIKHRNLGVPHDS